MAEYACAICGYVYNEETGDDEFGLPAGAFWDDLPDDFVCPVCGAEKEEFEPYEE